MIPLLLIALLTLVTAIVALSLRNLIHSALLLVASWAGIAAFYLWAGAEFVAFAQALVYVGAVSMIVLFAVLLTGRSRNDLTIHPDSVRRFLSALFVGAAVFGVLAGAVMGTDIRAHPAGNVSTSVQHLGVQMMNAHTAAVLIVGVILTVALLGAVVLAANDRDYTPHASGSAVGGLDEAASPSAGVGGLAEAAPPGSANPATTRRDHQP